MLVKKFWRFFDADDGTGGGGEGGGELFDDKKSSDQGDKGGQGDQGDKGGAGGDQNADGKKDDLFDDTAKKDGSDSADKDGKEKTEDEGPPETYADFTIPDEMKGNINPEVLTKFQGLAKELGLSQAKAQKLVDLQVELNQATQAGLVKQFNEYVAGLEKATIDEFGADYKEKLAPAARVFQAYDPDRKALAKLRTVGLDKDPDILRMLAAQGKDISEDRVPKQKGATPPGPRFDGYFDNSK